MKNKLWMKKLLRVVALEFSKIFGANFGEILLSILWKIAVRVYGRIGREIFARISEENPVGESISNKITMIISEAFPRGIWDEFLEEALEPIIFSEGLLGACTILHQDPMNAE